MAIDRVRTDDRQLLALAIDLSRKCPLTDHAFSVGAVLVDEDGLVISQGYSRDIDPHVHAEESALGKIHGHSLEGATLYSSLEPCIKRKSRAQSCAELIVRAGIRRVVIAWREPPLFVQNYQGVENLLSAGVRVVEIPELARAAAEVNRHIPGMENVLSQFSLNSA